MHAIAMTSFKGSHMKRNFALILLLASAFPALCASNLNQRYLICRAAILGVNLTSSTQAIMTTRTRLIAIIDQFPELASSADATTVVENLLRPDSPEAREWAKMPPSASDFITSFAEVAKSSINSRWFAKPTLDPKLYEFNIYISPLVLSQKLHTGIYTTLSSDDLTTYIRAGVDDRLSSADIPKVKELILSGIAKRAVSPKLEYGLLCTAYINQTGDTELLKQLWERVPGYRPEILYMCAYAKETSPLVSYGLKLSEDMQIEALKRAHPVDASGLAFVGTAVIQNHITSPIAHALASNLLQYPGTYYRYMPQLIYSLKKTEGQYPDVKRSLQTVRDRSEMLLKLLQ